MGKWVWVWASGCGCEAGGSKVLIRMWVDSYDNWLTNGSDSADEYTVVESWFVQEMFVYVEVRD